MKTPTALALVLLTSYASARKVIKKDYAASSSISVYHIVTPAAVSTTASALPATTSTTSSSGGVELQITTSSNTSLVGQYAYIPSSYKISFTPQIAQANHFNASDDPRYPPQDEPGCPFNRGLQAIPSEYYAYSNLNEVYTATTGFTNAAVYAWPVSFGTTAATVPNGSFVVPVVNSGTKEVWLQLQFNVEGRRVTANIPQLCGTAEAASLVLSEAYLRECQNITLGFV